MISPPFCSCLMSFILSVNILLVCSIKSAVVCVVVMLSMMICVVKDDMM